MTRPADPSPVAMEAEGRNEPEPVAWRYREIGAPQWEFRDDRAPNRPNEYDVDALYTRPDTEALRIAREALAYARYHVESSPHSDKKQALAKIDEALARLSALGGEA